ncbi:MAG: dienelactone hydrolase family protein [Stellaceae bacterium]
MPAEWISITAGGDSQRGYLAIPEEGHGPGLVLLDDSLRREVAGLYAEEGYAVLHPASLDPAHLDSNAAAVVATLRARRECTGKLGVLGFGRSGRIACRIAAEGGADAAILYGGDAIAEAAGLAPRIVCPLVLHVAEADPAARPAAIDRVRVAFAGRPETAIHVYPGAVPGFAQKGGAHYDRAAAGLAHSRSIALLRRAIGPHYDLEALWEAHIRYEFVTRDVAATMATMVADPYVNHIPVMTGGVGAKDLARFYANHFIPKCPKDIKMVPISRTVGADRVVDEMLTSFTHDVEIDWMLPGVPPTGRHVEVAIVAIVGFRGGRLYHEHIYWDQASVLAQIGLIDPEGLPVAGAEAAHKLADETRPSNTLMRRWADSAPTNG